MLNKHRRVMTATLAAALAHSLIHDAYGNVREPAEQHPAPPEPKKPTVADIERQRAAELKRERRREKRRKAR